jgi:hypothetical protein
MTLQKLNILILLLWTSTASLSRLVTWPLADVISTALTFIIVFILSGVSVYYFLFYRHQTIVHDAAILTNVGLVVSIFFLPLILFLADIFLPLQNPILLAFLFILFLLLPLSRPPLPYLPLPATWPSFLRNITHPVLLAFLLIAVVQSFCLHQYSFLPGLDAYTWLMKYEVSLSHQLYDLSAGINRVLFSTIIAIFYRLAHTSLFSLFKYWLPVLSLLPIVPLWLIARTLPGRLNQFLFLAIPLASPALILDSQTSRHQLILLLFLYLSLGLLFTANRFQLPMLFWLTFAACFVGILYHPLFLILILFWLITALIIHRPFINRHPFVVVLLSLIFLLAAHFLKLTSMFSNILLRLNDAATNFVTFHWNLNYPAVYMSEGLSMGWPGLTGVLKFYGFYAGPVSLYVIFATAILYYLLPSFRRNIYSALRSPFLLPITLFFLLLLFLAEILPRFTSIAYLPDRAWLLTSVPTVIFLAFIMRFELSRRPRLIFTTFYVLAILVSLSGTFYINHALAFSIPDYELSAAVWMKKNLPVNSYVFTSSSKNILRYYARVKLLRMEPGIIYSDNPQPILSRVNEFQDIIDPAHTYIYYAVTDPRNPFIERQYVSSYTQARPTSIFPALSSNPDHFELIYSQPNLVYLWRIK